MPRSSAGRSGAAMIAGEKVDRRRAEETRRRKEPERERRLGAMSPPVRAIDEALAEKIDKGKDYKRTLLALQFLTRR